MKTLVNKLLKGRISQSIINSTESLPGRWTKVTTMGCILALVFLGATSAQSQPSGTARPFKATSIYTNGPTFGTFGAAGAATHLGKFVCQGTFEMTGQEGLKVFAHVVATWTAANGDTIEFDYPEWVGDYSFSPPTNTGRGTIIGGTGRFADASGMVMADISLADASPGAPYILTVKGTISY